MISSRRQRAAVRCSSLVLAFCLGAPLAHAQDALDAPPAASDGAARETQVLAPDAFPEETPLAGDAQPAAPGAQPDPAPEAAASLPARQRALLPRALRVRVERCATPPFELEALAHVLDIELVALGIGEPPSTASQPVVLTLSLPACGDELRIELQGRGQMAVDTLRASDFEGVGRERALALATIERLPPLWTQVLEAASRPQPLPSAEPPAHAPAAPNRELHAGFGVGFIGAPSYELRLTLDHELARALYFDVGVTYATEAGRRILAEVIFAGGTGSDSISATVQAHAVLAHAGLEGRVGDGSAVHLFVASGLTAGVALADGELEGELPASQGHLAPSNSAAPLVLTDLALGVRVALGARLIASARFEARYIIVGPTFSAIDVPVIEWTGLGLCAGIGIGYGF